MVTEGTAPPTPGYRLAPIEAREYRCPQCARLLIVSNVPLMPGWFVQAQCDRCKRERRFVGK